MHEETLILHLTAIEMGVPEEWLARLTPDEQQRVEVVWNWILRFAPPAPGIPRVCREARRFLTTARSEIAHRTPRDLLALGDVKNLEMLVLGIQRRHYPVGR